MVLEECGDYTFDTNEVNTDDDFFTNKNNNVKSDDDEKLSFTKKPVQNTKPNNTIKSTSSRTGVSNTLNMQPKKGALNLGKKKIGAKKLGSKIDFDELQKKALEEQEIIESNRLQAKNNFVSSSDDDWGRSDEDDFVFEKKIIAEREPTKPKTKPVLKKAGGFGSTGNKPVSDKNDAPVKGGRFLTL